MTRFYQAAAALLGLTGTVLTAAEIPNLTFRQVPIPQLRTINPQTLAGGSGGKIWFTDRTFRQVGYIGADNSIHAFKLTDSVDGSAIAGPVTVEISAISNSTGQPIGTPITISDLGPGRVASVSQVLNVLQIPAGTESTVLVFARVVSGNAAIHGLISQVDAITRDGAVFEMSRADF